MWVGFGLNQNSGKLSSLRSVIILLSLRGSLGKKIFWKGFFWEIGWIRWKTLFFRLTWHLGKIPLESGRNLSLFVGGDQPRTLFCIIVDPHRRSINTSGGNTTTAMCFGNRVWQGPSFSSSWGLMMRLMMILMMMMTMLWCYDDVECSGVFAVCQTSSRGSESCEFGPERFKVMQTDEKGKSSWAVAIMRE